MLQFWSALQEEKNGIESLEPCGVNPASKSHSTVPVPEKQAAMFKTWAFVGVCLHLRVNTHKLAGCVRRCLGVKAVCGLEDLDWSPLKFTLQLKWVRMKSQLPRKGGKLRSRSSPEWLYSKQKKAAVNYIMTGWKEETPCASCEQPTGRFSDGLFIADNHMMSFACAVLLFPCCMLKSTVPSMKWLNCFQFCSCYLNNIGHKLHPYFLLLWASNCREEMMAKLVREMWTSWKLAMTIAGFIF